MLGEKMDKVVRRPRKGGYDVNGVEIGLNFDTLLVINVPDSRLLRVMSRSLFFVVFLLAVPSLCSILEASTVSSPYENGGDSAKGFRILPLLLRDLVDEGLIKKGHKGFVLDADTGGVEENSEYLRSAGIDLLTGGDEKGNANAHQVFDFVFSTSFHGAQLIDGMLKENGLIISQMGRDDSNGLSLLTSYKIVYLRRFENIMVAMRKTGASSSSSLNSAADEVLCGARSEAKKAALEGLEEVYLEPPPLEKKPSFTSRKIKFLPDLMKDSLDHYPRRVFISDDSGALDWFSNNYPMRNHEFEVYNAEANIDGSSSQETSLSSWLTKNVKLEDYVVMKAEAQVVEEMLKDKSLCLVDELFLECKNQWEDGEGDRGSKRAYWQCLALYGKVRDEGIAVHQWWK